MQKVIVALFLTFGLTQSVSAADLDVKAYDAKTGETVELQQTKDGSYLLIVDGKPQMELVAVGDGDMGKGDSNDREIEWTYDSNGERAIEWTYKTPAERAIEWTYQNGIDKEGLDRAIEWTYSNGIADDRNEREVEWTY
jgi:hypothetical protein